MMMDMRETEFSSSRCQTVALSKQLASNSCGRRAGASPEGASVWLRIARALHITPELRRLLLKRTPNLASHLILCLRRYSRLLSIDFIHFTISCDESHLMVMIVMIS